MLGVAGVIAVIRASKICKAQSRSWLGGAASNVSDAELMQ